MSETEAADENKSSSWRAWLFNPTREQRIEIFFFQLWLVVGLSSLTWITFEIYDGSMDGDEGLGVWFFWLALMGRFLTFHLGLATCICGVIAAFAKRWKLVAASLPLSLRVLIPVLLSFGNSPPNPESLGTPLTISSTNLLMINKTTEGIVKELTELNPDVMVFQEYSPLWHSTLHKAFSENYPHRVHVARRDSFGAAIYSKKRFLNKKKRIRVGAMEVPTFRVRLMHEGKAFVLYNIHTLPPRKMEYVVEQRRQFRDLKNLFAEEKDPVLLCGDFNWTEHSQFHRGLLDMGFREGHDTVGSGRGGTWPVLKVTRYLPGIRLDHMYAFGDARFVEHWSGYGEGSDHRPIFARVAFKKP
ncbi:MAG: endonuclease/exonuclease/phosphatase family protein [Planctomycetota bacterium]|nr:endonuclease/exonuclease/phosphatase family protein [Planctomycetota bacterium]